MTGLKGREPIVFVVSDSIGETADLVVKAAASQFNAGTIKVRRFSHVIDTAALDRVIAEAEGHERVIIVYTLIRPELREALAEACTGAGIPAVDIMGPTMDALGQILDGEPHLEPGLVHRLDEDYFRRMEAIEFAVKYDDGKDPRGLVRADAVLVGVSRTSKTPVTMYLAHRRYRVANIPLVPEVPPPDELYSLEGGRVIGLTIQPDLLIQIRQERLRSMGLGAGASYGAPERVRAELAFAHSVFRELNCPVIDVTNKAVEETANMVVQMLRGRRRL